MQPKYLLFRAAYREFVYEGFDLKREKDGLRATYRFDIPGLVSFSPCWLFPFKDADPEDPALRALAFNLGMAELVSYWKCCCPPKVTVKCGKLSEEQAEFWKKLYFNGLGEFFYLNGIDAGYGDFMTVESCGETLSARSEKPLSGALIPVGGGKDSVLTLELTRNLDMDKAVFMINPKRAGILTSERAGYTADRRICPQRTLDPALLRLNSEGFLNGHTPFSAVVAFSAVLCAYLSGKKYVVLSNESSANESTVGTVNHQYSKSVAFERDFREYLNNLLGCGVEYFSLLRPFTEIRIARDFSRFPEYFPLFLSCNLGSKTDSWCANCPKCLFVYLLLLPFVGRERVNDIFGADIADSSRFVPDLKKLLGVTPEKPFECVGSREEARLACELACREARGKGEKLPLLLREYESYGLPAPDDGLLTSFDGNNFVPEEFLPCLDDSPRSPAEALAAEFAGKSLAIMGFGREGQSTYRYYRSLYPCAPLIIADKNGASVPDGDENVTVVSGAGYARACADADMIMISPGIPRFDLPQEILPKLTGQTELFLKHYGNVTLGVTGTKGKSTCSSLLAAVIPGSLLVGNIGRPVFDCLPLIKPDTSVVYELSCHQLEDCRYSPADAVITNLFEEHLDHYGTFERYFAAKKNIFKGVCRGQRGPLVYDLGDSRLSPDELPENRLTYSVTDPAADIFADFEKGLLVTPEGSVAVDREKLLIKGAHNFGYAAVAYFFAKRRGVSDGAFLSALYGFAGLPHRMEPVAKINGVTYYDDSISTIPQAAVAGLSSLPDVGSVIIGGMERQVDLSPLADFLSLHPLDAVILIPVTGGRLFDMLSRRGVKNLYPADSLETAVELAARLTPPGKNCLFSPAAASYHLYKNFEERGDRFKELVLALDGEQSGGDKE